MYQTIFESAHGLRLIIYRLLYKEYCVNRERDTTFVFTTLNFESVFKRKSRMTGKGQVGGYVDLWKVNFLRPTQRSG